LTLPNSNHEGKGSPIEKIALRAKVSRPSAKNDNGLGAGHFAVGE
jgi:hypothetical protein